jgi:hypothetical protein
MKKSVVNKNNSRQISKQTVKTTFLSRVVRSIQRNTKYLLKKTLLSRSFNLGFKVLIVGMVSFSALYAAYALIGTTILGDVVVSKSEIISRIGKLTTLPIGAPDAVVRVQDPESLKKQNQFYSLIKEGDYIVMYPQLAVIYDLRNNAIIGIKHGDQEGTSQ